MVMIWRIMKGSQNQPCHVGPKTVLKTQNRIQDVIITLKTKKPYNWSILIICGKTGRHGNLKSYMQ